jgi:hypothetical protein
MFLFESIPLKAATMWLVVVASLILLNEMARRSRMLSLSLFFILPVVLSIFVWPYTVEVNSEVDTWFNWIKVYSSILGCLGILAIRFIKQLNTNKYLLLLPAIMLALNILIAVIRELQVYHYNGIVDGIMVNGGPWNILNAVAGLLIIVTITGWRGIYISKSRSRDMIWPDQLWFWISAYSLWNFAFVYNCASDHSFYSGGALLISSLIPAFFLEKGAWLQHRAYTLAAWMMFTLSYPAFVGKSDFSVNSSHSEAAQWFISGLSLISTITVAVFHLYQIVKHKRNPLVEEIYTDLVAYQKITESKTPLG